MHPSMRIDKRGMCAVSGGKYSATASDNLVEGMDRHCRIESPARFDAIAGTDRQQHPAARRLRRLQLTSDIRDEENLRSRDAEPIRDSTIAVARCLRADRRVEKRGDLAGEIARWRRAEQQPLREHAAGRIDRDGD